MCDEQRRLGGAVLTVLRRLSDFVSRYGKRILAAGLLASMLFLLAYLILQGWDTLHQFRWRLRPFHLAIALACHATSLAGTYVVWRLIMARLGSSASKRVDFYAFYLSLVAKKVPPLIWYAGTRSYLYKEEGISPSVVLNAIALEIGVASLSGTWAYVLFLPGYTFTWYHEPVGGGVFAVALLLTLLLITRPQLFVDISRRIARKWQKDIELALPGRRDVVIWALIYLVAWFIGGLSFHFTIRALVPDGGPNWADSLGVATLVTLVALLNSLIPAGVGLKELTTGFLLSDWLPMPVGLLVALAYRILQTADELLWAFLAYLLKPKKTRADVVPFE